MGRVFKSAGVNVLGKVHIGGRLLSKMNAFHFNYTEWIEWLSHREQIETKQQPDTAWPSSIPGCCLVYLRFLCNIHSIHPVVYLCLVSILFTITYGDYFKFGLMFYKCLLNTLPHVCPIARLDRGHGETVPSSHG